MTTLSIYFSSYCGYYIINYLTWKVNKMKKGTTAVCTAALVAAIVLSPATAFADTVTSDSSVQHATEGSRSQVQPLAEGFPAEGGTWQYGRNLIKAWSNYFHPSKVHASTVTSGNKKSVSPNTRAGYWSYATLNGFYSTANYYYRVV